MNRQDIQETVIQLLKTSEIIDMEETVDSNSSLSNEYGIDSLKLINVIMLCEDKFNIEFDLADLDLSNFESINTVTEAIRRKVIHD